MMKQLKVLAASALVAELDGSVLAEKNAHQRVPIASVTKLIIIYQLYAAVERHQLNWTDQLTTTKRIAEFTKGEVVAEIKLTEGETYTVKD
ncbi:serine hydrolase, partial [Oenococcus oeni]